MHGAGELCVGQNTSDKGTPTPSPLPEFWTSNPQHGGPEGTEGDGFMARAPALRQADSRARAPSRRPPTSTTSWGRRTAPRG